MLELHTTEVARVLQSVIAPAFLLAGIGTFINVMTQRLTKVVDQAREFAIDESDDDPTPEATKLNLLTKRLHATFVQRARLVNLAITLATAAAVMICMLIALLLADALIHVDLSVAVVLMFVVALMTLISALLTFLFEIFLATKVLRGDYLRTGRRPRRKAA